MDSTSIINAQARDDSIVVHVEKAPNSISSLERLCCHFNSLMVFSIHGLDVIGGIIHMAHTLASTLTFPTVFGKTVILMVTSMFRIG